MVYSVYRAAEILSMLSAGKNRITDIGKIEFKQRRPTVC
jgi:hypothetical protein